MAKRVMRSNRRTQRRRGSQLKQRKKRSKLLKRTLKRRNSFRKKNTYKRRKTMMKRGGSPIIRVRDLTPEQILRSDIPLSIPEGKLDELTPEQKQAVEKRIKDIKVSVKDQKMRGTWPEMIKAEMKKNGNLENLSLAINGLIGGKNSIYVTRSKDEICRINKVLMGKIYFYPDSNCKSFNKLRRGWDWAFSDPERDREITMNINNLLSGYGFTYIFSGEINGINDDGYLFY